MIKFETQELVALLNNHSRIPNKRGFSVIHNYYEDVSMITVSPRLVYSEKIIHPEDEVLDTIPKDNNSYYFPGNILKTAVKNISLRSGWGELVRNGTTTQFISPDITCTFQYDGKSSDLEIPNILDCLPKEEHMLYSFYICIGKLYKVVKQMSNKNNVAFFVNKDSHAFGVEELVPLVGGGLPAFANISLPDSDGVWGNKPLVIYQQSGEYDNVLENRFELQVNELKLLLRMFHAEDYGPEEYVQCVIGKVYSPDFQKHCVTTVGLRASVQPLDTDDVLAEGWILTAEPPTLRMRFTQRGTYINPLLPIKDEKIIENN